MAKCYTIRKREAALVGFSELENEAFKIPEKIKGLARVTKIADGVVSDNYTGPIVLPKTITYISRKAIAGIENITTRCDDSFNFTIIDGILFYVTRRNYTLKNCKIPADVRVIAEDSLSQLRFVDTLQIPSGVNRIIPRSLSYSSFRKIILKKSIKYIERFGICNNGQLETLILPNKLYELGMGALSDNPNLTKLHLPKNIVNIPHSLLKGDSSLREVELPPNLKTIGNSAFWGCGIEKLDVPDSVEQIYPSAFCSTVYLKEIRLPSKLIELSLDLFWGSGLQSITIPKGVRRISSGVFHKCFRLKEVIFEEGSVCEEIGQGAFMGCTKLKEIKLPETISKIGLSAFADCTQLEEITIPSRLLMNKSFIIHNPRMLDPNNLNHSFDIFFKCNNLKRIYSTDRSILYEYEM